MKRVIVHIDRLVLKGFRCEDRYAIGEALREELARQLSSPVSARLLVSAGDSWRLKVGEFRVGSGVELSQVGTLAARGIGGKVTS
jgi:mRNA-degrading endonuclease RelE of RelBE toxin-antitoxin system